MASIPDFSGRVDPASGVNCGDRQLANHMCNSPLEPICEDKSLELTGSEFSRVVSLTSRYLSRFLDSIERRPVAGPQVSGELNSETSLPQAGQPIEEVLAQLFEDIVPASVDTASPRYFGYIPGGGLPHAAIADLIAGTINRYVGVRRMAPACAQLESDVTRWLCEIVGFGTRSGGYLTSGGSLANWSALVTAFYNKLGTQFSDGLIYASDQTHHSIRKAAKLAGVPASNIRVIKSDGNQRVCLSSLSERIASDLSEGLTPCLLVGNAGTTNTGAVDDLRGLSQIATANRMWFHVDAAYGGFFALTAEGKRILKGLSQADSITLDPHKGLFLPYGTGALLVKDVETLKRVYQTTAPYIQFPGECVDSVDVADVSPELTRAFRALRIWLPLKMHGLGPFRANLNEKLTLARWLYSELVKLPCVEATSNPQLSTVTFRIAPPGLDKQAINKVNERALRFINERGQIFITPTTLGDDLVMRVCILSFRTHLKHVELCLEEVRSAAMECGLCRAPA